MATSPAGRGPQDLCVAAETSWLGSPAIAASGVAARVKSADSARPGDRAAGEVGGGVTQTNAEYLCLAPHTFIPQQVIEGPALWTPTQFPPITDLPPASPNPEQAVSLLGQMVGCP